MSRRLVVVVAVMVAVGALPAAGEEDIPARGFTYVTASDGTSLAVAYALPRDYEPGGTYPTLFEMSGYPGAVVAGAVNGYAKVSVSQRGSGCSGGEFELFTERVGLDGHEVIEGWIVEQPWSDGRVGILGHSFSGLNGFRVAATAPPHVEAVRLSGLIEDLYRGISYPGGVVNGGFPVLWTALRAQPDSEQTALERRGQDELAAGDPTCAANIATRPPSPPYLAMSAANAFDGDFWNERSLDEVAARVRAPIHITHAWQDQSTGPSGVRLWELLPDDIEKRLVVTNGKHSAFRGFVDHRDAWLDCWLMRDGAGCPADVSDPEQRVRWHAETTGDVDLGAPDNGYSVNPALAVSDYPAVDTDWTRLYLRSDGALDAEPPSGAEPADTYLATPLDAGSDGRVRQVTGAPHKVAYEVGFDGVTPLLGPMVLSLWLTVEAPDTDIYVSVADVAPDGSVQYLQRGLLRASHRALDEAASVRLPSGPEEGALIRARHPHTAAALEPLTPGQPTKLEIELFDVGHVLRTGHRLRLEIGTPPQIDHVGRSAVYGSPSPPADVAVLHDAAHPSSLLVPVVRQVPPLGPTAPACGTQSGIRCG